MDLVGPIKTTPAVIEAPSAETHTGSAETSHAVMGKVVGVGIKYTGASVPNTAVVVIRGKGSNPLSIPIFTITGNTNGWFFPHTLAHNVDDGSEIADFYAAGVPVFDIVEVILDEADEDDIVEVWLLVE